MQQGGSFAGAPALFVPTAESQSGAPASFRSPNAWEVDYYATIPYDADDISLCWFRGVLDK